MPKLFQKIIEQVLSSFDVQEKEAQALKKELESNFLDHKDYLLSQGLKPKEAEKIVIEKFGNPTIIGKMFQKYYFTKNIKKAIILAKVIGIISITLGLDYIFRATFYPIRFWGILSILAGICAIIASKTIGHSKFWQRRAIFGFFFLAVGQIAAIVAGFDLLNRKVPYCEMSPLSVICVRLNEVFLGFGIHFLLFSLCLWTVYEILAPKKMTQSSL